MKTKLSISILLGLLTAAFVFNNSSKEALPPQPNNNNAFLLGAMNNYVDAGYQYTSNPDVFGMNLWHRYVETIDNNGRFEPKGWSANDLLEATLNQYETDVNNQLTSNNNYGMRTLMHRPKIDWLAYGQSSMYQCETISPDDNLWFYSFNDHNTGIPIRDRG
jgi:hypothetical protein